MITSAQADQICGLLVDYREAIVELTTAAPEDRMAAAYKFADIDRTVHELVDSWIEASASDGGSYVRIECSGGECDSDGWIEWGGGKRPVENTELIEIKTRNGGVHLSPATHHYEWRHFNKWSDIVAYRIVRK